jgi:hypothetical protein
MLEAVGHRVHRLHRRAYAGLDVSGLEPGRWRELDRAEVEVLRARAAAGLGRPSGRPRSPASRVDSPRR